MKHFLCIFMSYLLFLEQLSFAASTKYTKKTLSIRNQNTSNLNTQVKIKDDNKTQNELKLSCEERYNLCMDNVCVNEQGIRNYCDTSLDSFETIIRDSEKVRIGNDLYTYARGLCYDTLKNCDLKERNHIETAYKIKIQDDLFTKNYLDALKASSEETQKDILNNLVACMTPICGNNFTDCLTIKDIERRFSSCEHVLKETSKPLSVKKAFYEKIFDHRKKLCSTKSGFIDYDSKVCKVKVSFGSVEIIEMNDNGYIYKTGRMSKEVASRTFDVGEIVECTQEYFNTDNSKRKIGKGIVDIALGTLKAVAGVVLVVVGVVTSEVGVGVPMALMGAGLLCSGVSSGLKGSVKINTSIPVQSACFINGQMAAQEKQYFKINF